MPREDDIHLSKMTAHDLIDWLDREIPHKCIDPMETTESAHRYAGAREVVDQLIWRREQEREDASAPSD